MKFFLLFFSAIVFAQQTSKVDFTTMHAQLALQPEIQSISGKVQYEFKVLSIIDTIRIDAKSMFFEDVRINNKPVHFIAGQQYLKLFEGFKKGKNTLTFHYKATPKQALYFVGEKESLQIWSQGQGKYTSHWLPSFDDVNEKLVFSLTVQFAADYEVLSNGVLTKTENGPLKTWHYAMKQPMSSYLVMLAIGKFAKKNMKTTQGTPLEFYLAEEDRDKFETTYAHSQQMFDYLEQEIGVPYPWEVYRQVAVRDFLYGGMENTTATIFAQDYVVDAVGYNDKTYVNVNAHELAHQWFGDLITATTSEHHWLQEGFATYYALLAEKELFGEDHFNWKLYEMAERLTKAKEETTQPILNAKASSLVFYQKGAWALHILRNKIGADAFKKAVKNYLLQYRYKNVSTDDFLKEVTKASGYDTSEYKKIWLEKSGFETKEAIALLEKNGFMKQYFEWIALHETPFSDKKDAMKQVLQSDVYYPLKQEMIYQMAEVSFEEKEELLSLVMASNAIKPRQAVARIMVTIPEAFKTKYESLLEDDSYITKEIALGTLWKLFPEHRAVYLNKTKNYIGFNDKNIRTLWLALALLTKDYEASSKVDFYDELLNYATSKYENSIRQNAITYLLYINPNDTNIFAPLVNATTHPVWRFALFARNQIKELLKSDKHRQYFINMLPDLNEKEKNQLQKLLNA